MIATEKSAVISECGTYRYRLERRIYPEPIRSVNFIMLNPSTADATDDDPTIRRCVGFAKSWACDLLIVTNLFALRSTDPKALRKHPVPAGPENNRHIKEAAREADVVVAAWGNHGTLNARGAIVLAMLKKDGIAVHRLGPPTKERQPNHPLYLKADLKPELIQ